ncbi:MAG: MFS transporter [Bacteroidota bacterium]|nr:MFS transporter [Bacteroidota bacterium]
MFSLFNLYRDSFSSIQRNIWILSISMFINRSGSMVLLFTSLYLTKDLHFSIPQAGLVLSFYGIGSVLGSYAGGWLTDRRNFFDIMVVSLISSGLILLFLLIVESPVMIGLVIFLYALTADMFRPANSKAIAAYSIPENRTRSLSLVRLAINLGFSIGPAAGGFIALYLGYKWLFVIDACSGFAAAAMLFIYLPRPEKIKEEKNSDLMNQNSISAYKDLPYLFFILLVSFYGICFFQLFASVPQYFATVCHYHEDTIGLLLGLNGLLVVLIEMPLVMFIEKKKQDGFRWIIRGVLCVPFAFAFLLYGNCMMLMALIYTLIITMSEIFAMPFMMNYSLSRGGKERQGQYSALYSIAYGLANIVAPVLGLGIAGRYGFDALFIFLIGFGLFTTLGFMWLRKRTNKITE